MTKQTLHDLLGKPFGDYQLLSYLGGGGMGDVFLARTTEGQEVALKTIREEALSPEMRKRFLRETRIALKLEHENVVRTFDAGDHDGTLYLVCELVRGGSLRDLIRKRGSLSEHEALSIARDLLRGLDAIQRTPRHEGDTTGFIHRDVKPENLLLTPTGVAKLCDLGLARSTSVDRTKYTKTGRIMGTPAYMAPEQIDALSDLDIRCDLYATGALLYCCLTGEPPYKGSIPNVLSQHLLATIPDVRALVPAVRAETSDLVRELLAKERDDRPASAQEALTRVESLLASAPGGAAARRPLIDHGAVTLPPDYPVDTKPLRRARLRVKGPDGERSLFVYAGSLLRAGRNAVGPEQEVCLRLRPAAEGSAQISGHHFMITVDSSGAQLRDLGSSRGTTLNGQRLAPETPHRLWEENVVEVAGVLTLRVTVIPPTLTETTLDGVDPYAPSVLVERPDNGSDHAYALVPGRLGLGIGPDGGLTWSRPAGIELVDKAGGLHLKAAGSSMYHRVSDGLLFEVGDVPVDVLAIDPADQK